MAKKTEQDQIPKTLAAMDEPPIEVLVIDEDGDDLLMLKDLLGEVFASNVNVVGASSYNAGKLELAQHHYDVCFLDYRLGVKTGLEFLKEVIQEGCITPLILLTGYGEHDVDLEAMRSGAADYLVKDQISPFLIERSIRYSIHRAQNLQKLREREAQVLVQDRMASIGLLASSLAHEIGTPLGVIRGRAEYLSLQLKNDPSIQKNADVIISQIDRVSKLIRSLLNLARGDEIRGGSQIHLNQVVEEVLSVMGHELRRHSIEIQNEVSNDYLVRVMADAEPLHQVLLNLFVNSMHAVDTAVKGGRLTGHFIRVSVAEKLGNWVLSVQDSGCGISEKNMRNLFKPFFTTKDIGVGTGLGLVTSYRIIESWGGSIQVDSKEGIGTTFRILLPKP